MQLARRLANVEARLTELQRAHAATLTPWKEGAGWLCSDESALRAALMQLAEDPFWVVMPMSKGAWGALSPIAQRQGAARVLWVLAALHYLHMDWAGLSNDDRDYAVFLVKRLLIHEMQAKGAAAFVHEWRTRLYTMWENMPRQAQQPVLSQLDDEDDDDD